jgi:hypothetical protein
MSAAPPSERAVLARPGHGLVAQLGYGERVLVGPRRPSAVPPANSTIGQFEIHASDVPSAREVIIIASAVVEERAHLTIEPR